MGPVTVGSRRELTERQGDVLEFIREHPYSSRTDIERSLGLDHGATRWTIEGLVKRGLVERFETWVEEFGGRVAYSYVARQTA